MKDCKKLSGYFHDKFSNKSMSEIKDNMVMIKEIDKIYYVNSIDGDSVNIGRFDERVDP
jgi:hypothetical protein